MIRIWTVIKIIVMIGLSLTEVLAKGEFHMNIIQTTNTSETIEKTNQFCVYEFIVDKKQSKRPELRSKTYELRDYLSFNGTVFCDDNHTQKVSDPIIDQIVMIKHSPNCDINKQIDYFRNKSINGLIVSIECSLKLKDINISETTVIDNEFSISFILNNNSEKIQNLNSKLLKIFDIQFEHEFDMGEMAVIFCLATFSVVMGAFWSGNVRFNIFLGKQSITSEPLTDAPSVMLKPKSSILKGDTFFDMTALEVFGFVLLMSISLLALYFFYKQLIYLFLLIFILMSMFSVASFLQPIAKKVLSDRLTKPSFTLFEMKIGFYKVFLFVIGICLAVLWFVTRHQPYSWILHDILGVTICMFALKLFRMPSLKMCMILLWTLFFYDIFMVFITPIFTKSMGSGKQNRYLIVPILLDGRSIMVDAATGGARSLCGEVREANPMLIKVPHRLFQLNDLLFVCIPNSETILGFGDIVIPGFVVAYGYSFDLIFDIRYRIYFVVSSVFYGIGLIITFTALVLMSGTPQPALLYLVPIVTLPVSFVGCLRNEWHSLWIGPEHNFYSKFKESSTSDNESKAVTETSKKKEILKSNLDS